MNWAIEEEQ
jgi:hypothetical protein